MTGKTVVAGVVLVLIGVLIGMNVPTVEAAPHPCDAAARSELGRLGVSLDTLDRTSFVDVTDGGRSGIRVVGYEAWTSLTTCRGSVVTKFDLACRVRETYARGDCRLTGVRTY